MRLLCTAGGGGATAVRRGYMPGRAAASLLGSPSRLSARPERPATPSPVPGETKALVRLAAWSLWPRCRLQWLLTASTGPLTWYVEVCTAQAGFMKRASRCLHGLPCQHQHQDLWSIPLPAPCFLPFLPLSETPACDSCRQLKAPNVARGKQGLVPPAPSKARGQSARFTVSSRLFPATCWCLHCPAAPSSIPS